MKFSTNDDKRPSKYCVDCKWFIEDLPIRGLPADSLLNSSVRGDCHKFPIIETFHYVQPPRLEGYPRVWAARLDSCKGREWSKR